jgi:uncharacterized small protein (DUF1192 family)
LREYPSRLPPICGFLRRQPQLKLLIDTSGLTVNYCAMDDSDNLPLRGNDPLTQLTRQDLDPLSLDELDARISALQGEISRCEAKKKTASSHMKAADALFKRG